MIKNVWFLFLICLVVSFVRPANAEKDEITVVGGVTYSVKKEDFTVGGRPFSPEFRTLEWSVITAYQSSYLKFNIDQSIKDHFQITSSASGDGSIETSLMMLRREDIGLTYGYSVLDNVSLFVGYTSGETSGTITGSYRADTNNPFPGNSKIADTEFSFKETGPFVGASYSYYFHNSGSLSFSLAYAQLDGEVVIRNIETLIDTGATTSNSSTIEGDANGLSYSLTWMDRFSEDMRYSIMFKKTSYEFDGPLDANGDDFDFDDIYEIFSIGFTKFF